MTSSRFDVLGLGNAIVDVFAHAEDDFLVAQQLHKGAMRLVDEPEAERLYAAMGAATLFFWLNRSAVAPVYRLALTITGLVTAIATYHYVRIFNSWEGAFTIVGEIARPSGVHFNDGYRYVDWLLTVPLLLVELLLVMRLSGGETTRRGWRLGLAAGFRAHDGVEQQLAGGSGRAGLLAHRAGRPGAAD